MKRALITGATGFLGSTLSRYLLKHGWNVHVLLRENSSTEYIVDILQNITVHRLTSSMDNLEEVLKLSKPDVVFHLASLFLAAHKSSDIAPLIQSNILFPTLLLEAMDRTGHKVLVNTGTSWQHYQNHDYSPVNLYASTKEAFDKVVQYYVEAKAFKVITLKLFDTYGPGDKRKKLFHLLRGAARNSTTINMSPGMQLLNIVYSEDVAEAFRLSGEMALTNKASSSHHYGVSANEVLPLQELVRTYAEITKKNIHVNWGALPYREREVMEPWTSYQKVPGWEPKVSLAEGIVLMERDSSIGGLLVRFR